MNLVSISVVCLSLAQLQPSQFDPSQSSAPIRSAQQPAAETASDTGSSLRFTDQQPSRYAPPIAEETTGPATLRPDRNWQTSEPSRTRVTPAQAEAPVIPVHSTNSEALAAMILDGAMSMRVDAATNVALVDVLSRVSDRASRQRAIQTYWKLSLAIAERNFARHESRYLSELPQPQSALDRSLLDADVANAQARQATADLKVFELQELLSEFSQLDLREAAQPIDRPFVGQYHTDFQKLFANRPAPARLRQINRRLPYELEVIERRAEAVAAGERAATELAQAYTNGSAGLTYVLDSLTKLSRNRRDLLAVVLSYNEQITEYSLAVVRSDVKIDVLLGTLIRRDNAARPTMVADANIRRASAESPVLEEGEVDGLLPLRPTVDPQTSTFNEPAEFTPNSRSILKRVTIDHP